MPLLPIEQQILDTFDITIKGTGEVIIFQYPPKVSTDTRAASWQEDDAVSTQEVSTFMGSKARTFNIEWTYIVGAVDGSWGIDKISEECRKMRNYFFGGVKDSENKNQVRLKLASHGEPNKFMTARLSDLNIKHGTAYVFEQGLSFPLRTDIAVTAKIWTKKLGESDDEELQPIKGLVPRVFGKWV